MRVNPHRDTQTVRRGQTFESLGVEVASNHRVVASRNVVSVNANRRHYYRAANVLARADRSWLEQLLTRRVGPDDLDHALARGPDDIKVVMEFQSP